MRVRRPEMQAAHEQGLEQLTHYMPKIEALARRDGLDFDPVDFELVPNTFMMEVAVYGLPIRMPHWSFGVRSEEHTSELQSLMRMSYAVFCLKKKKQYQYNLAVTAQLD